VGNLLLAKLYDSGSSNNTGEQRRALVKVLLKIARDKGCSECGISIVLTSVAMGAAEIGADDLCDLMFSFLFALLEEFFPILPIDPK
jgi:hypothetical protein